MKKLGALFHSKAKRKAKQQQQQLQQQQQIKASSQQPTTSSSSSRTKPSNNNKTTATTTANSNNNNSNNKNNGATMGSCASKEAVASPPTSTNINKSAASSVPAGPVSNNNQAASKSKKAPPLDENFRPRLSSYCSMGDDRSTDGSVHSRGSSRSVRSHGAASAPAGTVSSSNGNPKSLKHSTSAIGLDEMIETRRGHGDLGQNVVHIEVPFGKPIEEVYEGVHSGPVLGSGISGLVRLCTHKATGVQYAVKCLDLGLVDTAEGLRQLREEIFIMCQLDHPNIVRLEEVYESHSEIYLVQELCLGGELFDRLDEQPDYYYTEAECARLVKNMLSAVRYLHSKGIIHRDLKLENFLFSSTSQDSELKMIDFGLSKHFRYGEQQHEAVGTPYTVAPEVIRGCYDERCDIWAIGVITFLLLSGDPPFGGCGGPEPLMTVRANILKGAFQFEPADIWGNVSDLAKEYIKSLLVIDPKLRPTARDAQKHPWLKQWANRAKKEGDNVLSANVVSALVSFKEFSDMKKLLCEVLSFTLLPDQIKDLRKEFEKLDTDESGEISLQALKQVLMTNAGQGSLGALTEEEVEDVFNAMRVKKSEARIHWHEFIAAGLSQCRVDDRNLRLAFERLDIDHKGYITLDDIMDLMGNDDLLSEEAMEGIWADGMQQAKCPNARITYDDFLLLMKGQSADAEIPMEGGMGVAKLQGSKLLTVSEGEQGFQEGDEGIDGERKGSIVLPSGDMVNPDGTIVPGAKPTTIPIPAIPNIASLRRSLTPRSSSPQLGSSSTPASPAYPKDDENSHLIMNDDAGYNVGSIRDLTPPQTPTRGAQDYCTPLSGRRSVEMGKVENFESIAVPGLPTHNPTLYVRRRSRSVDDGDGAVKESAGGEERDFVIKINSNRAVMLPEHSHQKDIEAFVRDESKSALVVNRKLYRAHRQMRLAVLEASKRFEEQQAQHAKDVLMAQNEDTNPTRDGGSYHAGLVMKHGRKEHVTSEAIKKMLQDDQKEQEKLVEKSMKRGGRGRRTRKKTISDMSGMLSMGQDDLTKIAVEAATPLGDNPAELAASKGSLTGTSDHSINFPKATGLPETVPEDDDGHHEMREATVPGQFKKTTDPFAANGRYGHLKRTSYKY